MSSPSVLIVGAGPVGLTTALGLHHYGVPARDILVVDHRSARDPSTWSKALSVSASSLENFRILGIADRFLETGKPMHVNHFGGGHRFLDLNYDVIGTKYPFNMHIPQLRTESILLERCEEVGIQFSWNRRFIACNQTGTDVLATFRKPDLNTEAVRALWLIGCDGTQSAVREAAGISFEGTAATRYNWLADGYCDHDAPILRTERDEDGKAFFATLGDGTTARRLIGTVPLRTVVSDKRPSAPNENEIRAWAEKVFGSHYNFHDTIWSSVAGNGMRIAGSFRSGRVFIAGDAAHQLFPAGGQGMNTGLVDAVNLAWKLAAIITGKANQDVTERILDSYTTERRESALAVIRNIRMQMQVIFEQTEDENAVSQFITEALSEPSLNRRWAQRVTGFGDPVEPYQLSFVGTGGRLSDSMVGTRLTHVSDEHEDSLLQATKGSGFVLISRSGCTASDFERFKTAVSTTRGKDQVRVLETPLKTVTDKWESITALLIRPDFRIAWVARSNIDIEVNQANLTQALKWWLG